ncbi:crossover junction endonuclease MUS81 isoform X2 [Phymastichus coffea]|nr:crossover junction endonuclease MUS81 isoform X2 [Phymastichus coffea]
MKSNAFEHYSGWSAMSTLISKHYVIKKSNPAKYSLTDSGVALALSLIEGKVLHHQDSDNEDEDDDGASYKKQLVSCKSNKKPKSNSSISDESDSAKVSTSDKVLENRFSDSDDDAFKRNNRNNFETYDVKTKKPQSMVQNSDDELETALASSTETKASKPHNNLLSKTKSKVDARSKDEVEMALSLSLAEIKTKNRMAYNDQNDQNETDQDEELKKVLAISLNESKIKDYIDLSVLDANYLVEDKKIDDIIEQYSGTEMDEDIAIDLMHVSMRRLFNDSANKKKSNADPGFCSENVKVDEIICLDDDEMEDRSEKALTNNFESKIDSNNENDDSYIEFCKENAESGLHVKKKSKHFIFTNIASTDNDPIIVDAEFAQKNDTTNADLYSSPTNFDSPTNSNRSFEKHDLSTNEIGMYNKDFQSVTKRKQISSKKNVTDEIVISDDDEKVNKTEIFASPVKTSRKIVNLNKENSKATVKTQEEYEFPEFNYSPIALKSINVNPLKSLKNVSDKGNSKASTKSKEIPEDVPSESFTLLPNNFDIVLLVDTQETGGTKKKSIDDTTISTLNDVGVLYEVRNLKVGDFTWIARCRFTQKELILPYIIERKRIDDLGASIIDGRYYEQKHRLRQSEIKNVIYLIEHFGKTYHGTLPLTSLLQAGINTTVQDGFITKFTKDHKDSIFYLAAITRKLIRMYKSKKLVSCPKKNIDSDAEISKNTEQLMEFSEFNKAALKTKQFTVREMLIKQLVQLKGMSAEKAIGITELYPTPLILAEAFRNGDKNLLADIEAGSSKRKIGSTISNVLHMFYTRVNLN